MQSRTRFWRINEIDIGDLNRRNHDGGKMKIDMRMAEHYSLRKTKKNIWKIEV